MPRKSFLLKPKDSKLIIMLVGILLIIVIDGILSFSFIDFSRSSLINFLLIESISCLLGSTYVGWKIRNPSWRDGLTFGIVCFLILVLYLAYIAGKSIGEQIIVTSFSTFGGAFGGVLLGGYLFAKRKKKAGR